MQVQSATFAKRTQHLALDMVELFSRDASMQDMCLMQDLIRPQ